MPQVVQAVVTVVKVVATAWKAFAVAHPILAAAVKVVGSMAITKALSKQPKGLSASSGTQLSFKADTSAGIPIALGRTATGGNIVFQRTAGPNNKHLNIFSVLSLGPIHSFEKFTANQTEVAFNNANGNVTTGGLPFSSRMWRKVALGVLGAAAISQPATPATDSPLPEWSAAHKLEGFAHAWWDAEYDTAAYPSGLPSPLDVLKGRFCYDPRLDSTYPGGSGACRVNNEATWVWSENNYILGLTWVLGWHVGGIRTSGVGIPPAGIDMAAFVEGANVADANGWKCGGVVTTLDSKWQVLKAILQAGGGEPLKIGALVSCKVATPRTSLATVGVSDLAGGVSLPATQSRRTRINSIIPRYRSEAHNWQVVSADPVTVSDYVTFDGGLRQKGQDYALCQDAAQVAQLAAYDIVNAREIGPISLPLKPQWIGFKPGDAIRVNLPEIGLANQLMVIKSRNFDFKTGQVMMVVEYETTAKHAFALGQTASPPPTPGLAAPDFSIVPAPGALQWTATPSTLAGGGASVPCITLTGSTSDNAFAAEVIAEYKLTTDSDWTMWGSSPATSTTITIAGLGGTQNYDVAVSYKSIFGVVGARRVLGPVTTPAGLGTAASIDNQGALATRDDVYFGSAYIKESSGGITATRANFRTDQGTAAFFDGQGLLATLSAAPWSSHISGRPANLSALSGIEAILNAMRGNTDCIYPDPDLRDPSFWNAPAGVTFADSDGGWKQRRQIVIADGTYDFYSDLFPVDVGASYRIQARLWTAGTFSGNFNTFIHMPNVAWYSLKHGVSTDPDTVNSSNYIVAPGDTLDLDWVFKNPTGISNNDNRHWQFRFKGSFTGGPVVVTILITRVSALGNMLTLENGETLATNLMLVTSSGTAAYIQYQTAWATLSRPTDAVFGANPNLVYNGSLKLKTAGWILGSGWSWNTGAAEGPFFVNTGGGTVHFLGDDEHHFPVYPGVTYTLQANMFAGGMSAGALVGLIQWFDVDDDYISETSPFAAVNGQSWTDYSISAVAPAGSVKARAVFGIISATNTNAAVRRIKVSGSSILTVFSDEATNSALYGTGAHIDTLRPAEFGSDVTGSNTAQYITGQGGLAVLNSVSLADGTVTNKTAAYISYSSGGTVDSLKPGQVGADVTGSNTAQYISGQGGLAVLNSVSLADGTVTSKTATYLTFSTGVTVESLRPGEAGSDVTGSHTAMYFTGQAALATLNSVSLADGTVTSKTATYLTFSTGVTVESLRPAQAGADVTGSNTAQYITGQGTGATTNVGTLATLSIVTETYINAGAVSSGKLGTNATAGVLVVTASDQSGSGSFVDIISQTFTAAQDGALDLMFDAMSTPPSSGSGGPASCEIEFWLDGSAIRATGPMQIAYMPIGLHRLVGVTAGPHTIVVKYKGQAAGGGLGPHNLLAPVLNIEVKNKVTV